MFMGFDDSQYEEKTWGDDYLRPREIKMELVLGPSCLEDKLQVSTMKSCCSDIREADGVGVRL